MLKYFYSLETILINHAYFEIFSVFSNVSNYNIEISAAINSFPNSVKINFY